MAEKKSFDEIINENLIGEWCEGLAILNVSDDEITIDNIYPNKGRGISINEYPISRKEKVFSKVIKMSYEDAIREFIENRKSIISPRVRTNEIITFEGCKCINYGGNVYCYSKNNTVIVNDKHKFDTFDEIVEYGFISKEEKKGEWLVF